MSSFYTTKSLGKDWLPSPVRGSRYVSVAGRYGTYPALESPKWRSVHSHANGLNWSSNNNNKRSWSRWSKFHERIALAIALIILICLFHDNLQQRIENFRYNIYTFTHSSSTATLPPSVPATTDPAWAHFAYNFFAHDPTSLCSAVVHLRSLQRAGSKPSRLLSYPSIWTSADAPLEASIARLLKRAEQEYGAVLQPVPIPSAIFHSSNPPLMSEYGKLLPFNQTQFPRVAYVDTSTPSTLLNPLDEMFQFSEAAIAMPRAYWDLTNPSSLSDLLLLVQPDSLTFERLVSHFSVDSDRTNLEIEQQQSSSLSPPPTFMTTLNKLFDEATFLPHRDFLLRSSEFKQTDHAAYLGSFDEIWDAKRVIEEAKYVVFSDGDDQQQAAPPDCDGSNAQSRTSDGVATCAEREIWEWLKRDFRDRRMAVCGALGGGQGEEQEDVTVDDAVSSSKHFEAQNKIMADQEETERLLSQDMPELQVE